MPFKVTLYYRIAIYLSLLILSTLSQASSSDSDVTRGSLRLSSDNQQLIDAPLLKTDVSMVVTGLIARVTVTQVFTNNQNVWVEGKYLFPLPDKSAVDQLRMKIGERVILGEIKDKKEAQKIYRKARLSGKKASLVSQNRPNIFQNSVANIGPYETITVTIEYQQDVLYDANTGFSLRFPMTMTERYQPETLINEYFDHWTGQYPSHPSLFEEINAPKISDSMDSNAKYHNLKIHNAIADQLHNPASERENHVSIKVTLNSGFPLQTLKSQSHKITHIENSKNQSLIRLADINAIADRDFILNWQPTQSHKPRAALFTEQKFNESYLSLMFLPPAQEFIEQQSVPRESIFVIDTSGSMGGESIRQAKKSLNYALDTLTQNDLFNIIEFNSDTRSLYQMAQPVDAHSLQQAKRFVQQLDAGGGTEMRKAMSLALKVKTQPNSYQQEPLRQVFFLTDGAIANEAELFNIIESELGNTRLFTIGIGSAPNTFFMKKAARYGRGTFTFISDTNQVAQKTQALFEKIKRPQLTHIDIQWPHGKDVEMWPGKVPDLYSGEPVWIKAKVANLDGQLSISGRLTNSLWQSHFSLDKGTSHIGVASLWAREKIAGVMATAHHGKVTPENKKVIIETALKHHLVSRFTSLIAVDKTPSRFTTQLTTKHIPQHQPAGYKSTNQTSLSYPQTGLNLDIQMQKSILWMFIGVLGFLLLKRLS